MRAARARLLAARHPQAAEVLLLVAAAYDRIGDAHPDLDQAQALAERLRVELGPRAPEPLREARPDVARYFQQPDPYEPSGFWARLALEAWARHAPLQKPDAGPAECPHCGHAPQLGVLRPAGNGEALYLACSLCRNEWPFRRTTCPECMETDPAKIDFHTAAEHPAARMQSCSGCGCYLHLLSVERDPELIPEVDELALAALDVWAAGQGYHKVWPNLAGL